ncbi:MAG TPA: hypothetical protein VD996_17160 [Chitinophagaceae bacterium]|nr:hypothetical protein [Chitinophagaceae bacterium]
MTRFLMVLVLLATAVVLIAGSNVFTYDGYNLTEHHQQGEESKHDKGEHGKGKTDNDDKVFPRSDISHFLNTSAKHGKICHQQDAYIAYVKNPITPPPNKV